MNKESVDNLGVDPEDLEGILKIIEKAYDIRFVSGELAQIKTFGELSDHIIAKIKLQDKDDCTNQQGFYRLRDVIVNMKHVDKKSIQVDTDLATIFPRQDRLKDFKEIEKLLGFKLKALRPNHSTNNIILLFLLVSVMSLFADWRYGLIGVFISIFLFRATDKVGKEFRDKTIGDLTERMVQRNYLQSRCPAAAKGFFSQLTKLPSATADSDAQVGLGTGLSAGRFVRPAYRGFRRTRILPSLPYPATSYTRVVVRKPLGQ